MSLVFAFVLDDVCQIRCSESEWDGGRDDPKGWLFADVGGDFALPQGLVNSRKESKPTLGQALVAPFISPICQRHPSKASSEVQ